MTTRRKQAEVEDTKPMDGEVTELKPATEEVAESKEITVDEARKSEEVKTLIYIGPSLPGNILQQNSIFTTEFPAHVDEEVKRCPFIQELMVPVSQLSTISSNLAIKGTKEQIMYEKTVQFYREASK